MKYIPFPEKGIICRCNDAMFISYTPDGGDYVTCPVCWSKNSDSDFDCSDDVYHYCKECKILYDLGCTHAVNGCTSDFYYGKLVKGFKFNNIEYNGCPIFNSHDEYIKYAKLYELRWVCSCKSTCGIDNCTSSAYKQNEYKQNEYIINGCKNKCHSNMANEYADVNSKLFSHLSLAKHASKYSSVMHQLRMKLDSNYAISNIFMNGRHYGITLLLAGCSPQYQYYQN